MNKELTTLEQSFKTLTNCGCQAVQCSLGILSYSDFEIMPLGTTFTVRIGFEDITYKKVNDKYGLRLAGV